MYNDFYFIVHEMDGFKNHRSVVIFGLSFGLFTFGGIGQAVPWYMLPRGSINFNFCYHVFQYCSAEI